MTTVHVWWANPDEIEASDLQPQLKTLSVEEQGRYHRFVRPHDQHHYLAAHLLLRRSLALSLRMAPEQIAFETDEFGKPHSRQGRGDLQVEFSLSHTRGLVACALADEAIGIDVESVRRECDWELVRSVLTKSELLELENGVTSDRTRHFLSFWTLKEAYLKAIGTGLMVPPKSVEFDLSNRSLISRALHPALQSDARHAGPWDFFVDEQSFPQHVLAVACRNSTRAPLQLICRELLLME